jgi:ATP-dependent Clp protease ATP-binding subunit ClpA
MKHDVCITDQALYLLHCAREHAKRLGQPSATAAHVLMSLEKKPPSLAEYILNDLSIDVDELRRVLEAILRESKAATLASEDVAAINERAQVNASRFNSAYVSTEHVLLAALQLPGAPVKLAFERQGMPLEVAIARAEAITRDVADGKVIPERRSGSGKEGSP